MLFLILLIFKYSIKQLLGTKLSLSVSQSLNKNKLNIKLRIMASNSVALLTSICCNNRYLDKRTLVQWVATSTTLWFILFSLSLAARRYNSISYITEKEPYKIILFRPDARVFFNVSPKPKQMVSKPPRIDVVGLFLCSQRSYLFRNWRTCYIEIHFITLLYSLVRPELLTTCRFRGKSSPHGPIWTSAGLEGQDLVLGCGVTYIMFSIF